MSATGILQATTTISKTTQTAVGSVIPAENYEYFTLFGTYVKGNETGLDIIINFQRTNGGTTYPAVEWTETGGVYTYQAQKYRLTASRNFFIQFYIPAADFILITQGGSNNDGTPTGTLAASYTMSE
jgi:hypothetical protein